MRVDLRRRDVGVAQQLLHPAQVAGGLQHVAGEAVAQQVRVDALEQALLLGELAQAQLHGTRRDRAVAAREDRIRGARAGGRAPFGQRPARVRAHRHAALAAALAQHRHQTVVQVQVAPAQVAQLRQPQAGGIEQLEQGAVAQAQRCIDGNLDQHLGLVGVEHLRQLAGCLGTPDTGGRVGRHLALAQQPVVVAPAGREPPLQAARGQSAAVPGGHERADRVGIERLQRPALLPRPVLQRRQVAAVAVQRVRRHAPLDRQVFQVPAGSGHRGGLSATGRW